MKLQLTILALVVISILSCNKDSSSPAPTKVKTSEELLSANTWKAGEIRTQLGDGTTEYYLRGGTSNTINYDSDSLKFNTDNTGIYYYLGSQYTTTWNFINPEKSKMTLVINYPTPLTVNLENITLADTYFTYSQYVTSGVIYLSSVRRIPN